MKKIAFVDDEVNILDGLRRMLRPFRNEWDMYFFSSAEETLQAFKDHEFDLVISDMRMPRMNGAELLNRIKEISPSTIRVILSGFSSEELTLESVHAAHQFISKPTDSEKIKQCVQRAVTLQGMLTSEEIKAFLGSIESLPMLPVVYDELMRSVTSADASIRDVGQVVAKDIGLSSKILKLVAFFGLSHNLDTPQEATTFLGTDRIKNLALLTSVFHSFPASNRNLPRIQILNRRCEKVGLLAAKMAKASHLSQRSRDHCQVAGMMSGLGELIALSYDKNMPPEHDLLNDPPLVGSYLLGIWSLPFPVIEAVRWHRRPATSGIKELTPLSVVHASWAMLSSYSVEQDVQLKSDFLDLDFLLQTVGRNTLDAWYAIAEDFCSVEMGKPVDDTG